MKLTRTNLALCVAVLVLPMVAVGQNADGSTKVSSDNDASENIVVASKKSPGDLRRDLWRAEKEFYSIYNELNDDNIYDVRCTKDVPTGSTIKTQTCRPKFLARALKDGKVKNTTNLGANPEIARQVATFRENLETLVTANSDLQAALAALNSAHDQIAADKERRAKN